MNATFLEEPWAFFVSDLKTGRQKVLLEWHYRFGHSVMRQVQYILRQFPFVQFKLSVAEKWNHPVCEICEFAKACHHPKQSLNITKHVTHAANLNISDLCLVPQFLLIILNKDSWGIPLTPMVVLLQISLLVGVSLLTMHLDFSMLSIKLVSLQWRLSGQHRTLKNYVWIMVLY